MKTVVALVLVLALVPLSACAPKVNDPADVQAVKQTMEAYAKGILAADAPASVAMMTDKTAYFEPHFPAMTGKDAVVKFLKMAFEQFDVEMTPVVTDVQVDGNLATMHGTYTQKLTPKAEDAAAMPDSGNWTVAARRQADGSWKWDWIMGASDQPTPGTTADGAEEQALLKLGRDLEAAMPKKDMATLDRFLAKERNVFADGEAVDLAKAKAEFMSPAMRIDSITTRDLKVYVFGDAAISTGVAEEKGAYKGKEYSGSVRATHFFIKRNGQWLVVSSQISSIKQ